jgi:hypothetical protein
VVVCVQRYSVQYKGYNLVRVTTVEGDATRGTTREKKGRLEARRVPDFESLVDAVDRVHHFVILLLHSWSTPRITAGQL